MTQKSSFFNEFEHIAPVQKTLRFRLIPQGRTAEYIERDHILDNDRARHEYYPVIKDLADDFYRDYLNEHLSGLDLDWGPLAEAYQDYEAARRTMGSKELDEFDKQRKEQQDKYRSLLFEILSGKKDQNGGAHPDARSNEKAFDALFQAPFLAQSLPAYVDTAIQDPAERERYQQAIASYAKYSIAFGPYWQTRRNIMTDEAIVTAAPYRLVNENFPIFLNNISCYQSCHDDLASGLQTLETEMKTAGLLEEGEGLSDYFGIDSFNRLCTQHGIDIYNTIIGGFVPAPGKKIQGFNEQVNLKRQQMKGPGPKDEDLSKRLRKLTPLRKQILSRSVSSSFLFDQIEDDEDLWARIDHFIESMTTTVEGEALVDLYDGLHGKLLEADPSRVYIDAKNLSKLSHLLYSKWDHLRNGMLAYSERNEGAELKRYAETINDDKEIESLRNKIYFSIKDLRTAAELANENEQIEEWANIDILDAFKAETAGGFSEDIAKYAAKLNEIKAQDNEVSGNDDRIAEIKAMLDSVQDRFIIWRMLECDLSSGLDDNFYAEYRSVMSRLSDITALYNLVRNYLTRRPDHKNKYKLTFNCPSLADGWSESKVKDNLSLILRKDGQYYLAVLKNSKIYKRMLAIETVEDDDLYERMEYNFFPDAAKMIPKCCFVKEVKQYFAEGHTADYSLETKSFVKPMRIPYEVHQLQQDLYEDKYKKYQVEYMRRSGDTDGYRRALETWIDFCKDFLSVYNGTAMFDYSDLRDARDYEDLSVFYADVNRRGYQISFREVSAKGLDDLVDAGEVYLFRIHNKDLSTSKKTRGVGPNAEFRPNLHTLYWLGLFSDVNLAQPVPFIKLNGQAELFLRPAQVKQKVTHPKGSILLNKRDKDGKAIPEDTYKQVYDYLNHRQTELPEDVRQDLDSGRFTHFDVKTDVVKDKRYTETQMFFHVPIAFNWDVSGQPRINDLAQRYIAEREDLHIIGIDRGERNLLYYSVIDLDGRIVEQGSLNMIQQGRNNIPVDYHDLLDKKEKGRADARKNWSKISQIKEIKDGYMSQVVHKISQLIIKYNAIVILEDLNTGFKRGRFKVEKQVYQKFEMGLMKKLSALSFKTIEMSELGGVLRPWQLTRQLPNLNDLGRQNGIMFYVPAAYTSVTDPTTGFANLFSFNRVKQSEVPEFVSCFESLCYHSDEDVFSISFDYDQHEKFRRVADLQQSKWTVYTHGSRSSYDPRKRKTDVVDLTAHLKAAFDSAGLTLQDGDLLPLVEAMEDRVAKTKLLKEIFYVFKLTLQLRNKIADKDLIISPVKNKDGRFFESGSGEESLPIDADANGAYHIAMKGLLYRSQLVASLRKGQRPSLRISNKDWFDFATGRHR